MKLLTPSVFPFDQQEPAFGPRPRRRSTSVAHTAFDAGPLFGTAFAETAIDEQVLAVGLDSD